jgi:predicted nuclease of predicted toxin-antitoxin system
VKRLLDTCVWGGAVRQLTALGHDVDWLGSWESDPGDLEILQRAHREGRILVTQDKDFGELAVVSRHSHSGIVRLVDIPARRQAEYGITLSSVMGMNFFWVPSPR